jgi:DNA-directed RNA polymerase specialized sigma subunit
MRKRRGPAVRSQYCKELGDPDTLAEKVIDEKSPQLLMYEQMLRQEIESLKGRPGECLQLYMRGDFSIREIAAKLELGASTVQYYIDKAIMKIKKNLQEKGIV